MERASTHLERIDFIIENAGRVPTGLQINIVLKLMMMMTPKFNKLLDKKVTASEGALL